MQFVRPLITAAEAVPQRVRDLQRLNLVAQVLVRHGLGFVVDGLTIPGVGRIRAEEDARSTPERAVSALRELGPTFVKLGQVLSTRPDVLPLEYVEAFQALQDDAGPMPVDDVLAVLTADLGPDWRDHVATFEEAPLATASIAQVHGAVLTTGEEVVFKVQRPGLARVIRSDLNILHFLAERALAEFPEVQVADPRGMLDEFERSLVSELDFREEARNQRRTAELFADDPRLRIPEIHEGLSTSKVLCMERLRGVKITEARAAGHDMSVVGERALSVVYDMLFVHGFFHADAHPGNVLVLPGDVVGLLDFGMMGRMTQQMRNDVIFIIFALQRGDHRTIARLFYEIAIKTRRVDYARIERDAIEVMEQHWSGSSIREMQIGPFFVDLARKAASHGARMPPDYTMFFKALVTVEGLAKTVLPEVDPIAAAAPYFERLMRDRLDLDRLQGDALYHMLTLSSVLRRLPISLSQFLDDLDGQRLKLNVETYANPEVEDRQDRRWTRMTAALVWVGATACGTACLWPAAAWPLGFPLLTVVFYGIAGVAGTVVAGMPFQAWRHRTGRTS